MCERKQKGARDDALRLTAVAVVAEPGDLAQWLPGACDELLVAYEAASAPLSKDDLEKRHSAHDAYRTRVLSALITCADEGLSQHPYVATELRQQVQAAGV